LTKNKPAIVFVNRFYFPDESATSQILTDLSVHLAKSGFCVTVVTSRYRLGSAGLLPARANVEGVEVTRVWSTNWGGGSLIGKFIQFASFYPFVLLELLRLILRRNVLIAKTDPPLVCAVAMIAAKLKGAHFVNWLQDLYPEVASELRTPILRGRVGTWLKRLRNYVVDHAVMNVTIGHSMAHRLRQDGIEPAKIMVIPNWADEDSLRPIASRDSEARREWGLGPEDFVFGYSGNLGRAHEAQTMMDAATLLAHRSDIKFLLIGGGHEYARLRSAVDERKLGNFIFKPHQPRERLADTLGAADAHWLSLRPELEGLIVPSKFYGILAAGRPVIAICSLDGEVARVVRDNRCGFVVEPGDSDALAEGIKTLADYQALRQSMGERARELSETCFSKGSALAGWTELVRDVQQNGLATVTDPSSGAQKCR
jgi:colanic acid biosynthesis glycosyl transferase WcaI